MPSQHKIIIKKYFFIFFLNSFKKNKIIKLRNFISFIIFSWRTFIFLGLSQKFSHRSHFNNIILSHTISTTVGFTSTRFSTVVNVLYTAAISSGSRWWVLSSTGFAGIWSDLGLEKEMASPPLSHKAKPIRLAKTPQSSPCSRPAVASFTPLGLHSFSALRTSVVSGSIPITAPMFDFVFVGNFAFWNLFFVF